MPKLTETELDHAIAVDQIREAYWQDYRPPMTRVQSWTLFAALVFSLLTCAATVGLFIMWLKDGGAS